MALYDPNELPSKAKTGFTAADVLAWARTKPADEKYDYWDCHNCALGQFAQSIGAVPGDGVRPEIERQFSDYAYGYPRTFGAFAKRLESALA